MVSSVDDLIYFLLEQIALCSGLSYLQIESKVKGFYSNSSVSAQSQRTTNGREQIDALIKQPPTPTVDGLFLDQVWRWLTAHSEISVGSIQRSAQELHEEAASSDGHPTQALNDSASAQVAGELSNNLDRDSQIRQKYHGLLLKTTEERVWQAITGHDVDHSRVPKLHFDLLRHIAAAGEHGIVQPDLVRLSHQDKRSVPKRTDTLHQKDYIVKTAVRRASDHTSLCVLRKFAIAAKKATCDNDSASISSSSGSRGIDSEVLKNKETFLNAAFPIIKSAGAITLQQLCLQLGIRSGRSETGAVDPWLYHMELVGCIERTIPIQREANSRPAVAISLKFTRNFTPEDRDAYLKLKHKSRAPWSIRKTTNVSSEAHRVVPSDQVMLYGIENYSELQRDFGPVIWQPQRSFENQLYDLVGETGAAGISTIDIVHKLTGLFAYRTVETMLRNLTNVWQESQPPHLRHLAIVRDTSMEGGILHYRYWTHTNFQAGVESGLLSWDAIDEAYESFLKQEIGATRSAPTNYLDAWGFPRLSYATSAAEKGRNMSSTGSMVVKPVQQRQEKRARDTFADEESSSPMKRRKYTKRKHPAQESSEHTFLLPADISGSQAPRVLKVHTDFEKTVWNKATFLLSQQVDHLAFPNESDSVRKSSSTIQPFEPPWEFLDRARRKARVSFMSRLDEEKRQTLGHFYRDALFMTSPGLYIRPPQRLPRVVGRPKANLLLVVKSNRLKDKAWFTNASDQERFRLDPNITFDIPRQLCEGVAPSISYELNEVIARSASPLASGEIEAASADTHQRPGESPTTTKENGQTRTDKLRNNVRDGKYLTPGQAEDYSRGNRYRNQQATENAHKNDHENERHSRREESGRTFDGLSNLSTPSSLRLNKNKVSQAVAAKGRAGVRLTSGSVSKQRSDLILQIVRQCSGAYPGPVQLWYPYVTEVRKSDPDVRVDHKTTTRAISALEKSGKLKHLRFAFETWDGVIERSIYCLPELDRSSEIVRKVEARIREHYPLNYFPDGAEIDRSLNPYWDSMQGKRPSDKQKEVHHQVNGDYEPPHDVEYDFDDFAMNEEYHSWQTQFQVNNYSHQPAPEDRTAYGFRLGRRVPLDLIQVDNSSDDSEVDDEEFDSIAHDYLQIETELGSAEPFSRFVIAPETYDAARQESMREEQAFIEELQPSTASEPQHIDRSSPFSWLTSWWRVPLNSVAVEIARPRSLSIYSQQVPKPRFALCATLTDPDQKFQPLSGTFSTEFTVVRDIRPKLRLLTNIQRDYEDKIPSTLQDIIQSHVRRGRGRKRKLESCSSFEKIVDAVQDWEKENEQLLSSEKSLMVPRFINHSINQDGTLNAPLLEHGWPKPVQHTTRRQLPLSKPQQKIERSTIHVGAQRSIPQIGSLLSQEPQGPLPQRLYGQPAMDELPSTTVHRQRHRIVVSIVVVRTLVGGTDRIINKAVLKRLIPNQEWAQIRYQWEQARSLYPNYIENLEDWFQEAFIHAYEKGEVPRLDYKNAEAYDWQAVIDWVLKHAKVPIDNVPARAVLETSNPSVTPNAREHNLKDNFHVQERTKFQYTSCADFLQPLLANFRREIILNEASYAQLEQGSNEHSPSGKAISSNIARTYVRANLLTPDHRYQPNIARNRLVPFGDKMLEAAIEELQKAKIIRQENKGRPIPGRNYAMGKNFIDAFKTTLPVEIYTSAVQFKHWLDDLFSRHGMVEVSQNTSNGQMLALLNLRATGRLEVRAALPSITQDPSRSTLDARTGKRHISIWGFTEGSYKTTGMDARNLSFLLQLIPTTSWVYGIPMRSPLPVVPAPHLSASVSLVSENTQEKQIPLWFDIHDQFMPEWWQLVVSAVCTTLALLPGASAGEVSSCCRGSLMKWEIDLVFRWLRQIGVAEPTTEHEHRLVLCEWWWAVLGM